MTSFAISMSCWPPAHWGRKCRPAVLALLLSCLALLPQAGSASAQSEEMPGVRGNLYESPVFGFVVLLPQDGAWQFQSAGSDTGGDYVQAIHASGVIEAVAGFQDASVDAAGCAQGMLDALAASYPDSALTGWQGEDLAIDTSWPETARVQVLAPDAAGNDLYASITCTRNPGNLLLADLFMQPKSVVEGGQTPASLLVQAPARWNTGRPQPNAGTSAPGVVLFAARGLPILSGEASIPFNCLDQDTFAVPADPLPEGTGYFACDGQAMNVDDQPVTLDLAGFALGCLPGLPLDPEAGGCPDAPVRASHAQLLDSSTGKVNGATVTLQPGEHADLVIWFTLPEGLPPQDVLYLEGDRTFQAGTSYFAAGMGSRPRVRMTR